MSPSERPGSSPSVTVFSPEVRLWRHCAELMTLRQVVVEARHYSADLVAAAGQLGVPLQRMEDLVEGRWPGTPANLGLSLGFGHIFTASEIADFPCGIWNVHCGFLPRYRGRHPIAWALLEDAAEIGVTIHSIDTEIDRGLRLAEGRVAVLEEDDERTLYHKAIDCLFGGLLAAALQAANAGVGERLAAGRYLPSLANRYDTIAAAQVSGRFLVNLLRVKRHYGGVAVDGEIARQGRALGDGERAQDGERVVRCADGTRVALC
jgi:hypothetical protein